MDKDPLKGAAAKIGGKVKDAAGGMLGDNRLQADGKTDQASGQIQSAYGYANDAAREEAETFGTQADSFMKERPMAALLGAVGVGYVLAHLMHR